MAIHPGIRLVHGIRRGMNMRVVKRIESLADDPRPRGVQKLSGKERYRIRQGRYRILYSICDRDLIVYIVRIGHRKSVCRNL